MLSRKVFWFILMAGLILAACSYRSADFETAGSAAPMEAPAMEEAEFFRGDMDDSFVGGEDVSDFGATANSAGSVEQQAQIPQERLIIRTANLNLIVTDTEATIGAITEMVEANGGWVVNSSLYQYRDDAKSGDITVRVPVAGFNSAITAIKGLAMEVTSESSSGQDVTEEYVDLSSRLGNLEATADRVRNFLDETQNVEEALAVNQELSRLEGEIEVIKGRMQYLSQSAGFSTITVNLTPDIATQPIDTETWRPGVVVRRSVETLVDALQGIANFLIEVVIVLGPLALIFGLPLWLIIRYAVRRRRRRQAPTATE
ncbi:MAG: DUF4349 domain-containing protein [Ardenticatenaceae bacterium]|nr:DUF4349 domain-containing protein [Ardenticatenaceae bacterium]